jgi:hypothetical protein
VPALSLSITCECTQERGGGLALVLNREDGLRPNSHPGIHNHLVHLLLYVSEEYNCYLEGQFHDHITD